MLFLLPGTTNRTSELQVPIDPVVSPTAVVSRNKPTDQRRTISLMNPHVCIAPDVKLGQDVKLSKFINLYGCEVGDETKIGAFVEIQKNAAVGKRCKISSHTFICEGVIIEDNVFIGHGVMFINDSYPRATVGAGSLQTEADWKVERTVVSKGASIGSGATILSNLTIGENAIVGAGSVVTKNVPANSIVAGNPAKVLRYIEQTAEVTK
jgi:acetyltransferase-like isoleucine patch superfamily enzyme